MANVENVEEMVGTREAEVAAVATVSGSAVATEYGGADEGKLEFDEDELAALEGQCLVAEFTRCIRWPEQSSIIDPGTNVKKALCI